MINTGLMLKRPGESPYSVYRRFILANQCLSSTKQIISEINKANSSISSYASIDGYKPAVIASCYENFILSSIYKTGPILKKHFHPIKHCPKCAEIGFHTNLFDEIWIQKCPIHNLELKSRCHICNQHWPRNHELIKRNCYGCGVSTQIHNKLKHSKLKISDFEKVEKLISIISKAKNLEEQYELYSNYSNYVPRAIINNNHLFNISLMLHLELINISDQEILNETKIPLFKWNQKNFKIENITPKSLLKYDWKNYNIIEKKVEEIKNNAFQKTVKYFEDLNQKSQQHKKLLTLEIIKLLFFKNLNNLNEDLINEVSHVYNFYLKNTLKLPYLYKYFYKHDLKTDQNKKMFYKMPIELTLLIYEIDLWTLIQNVIIIVNKYIDDKSKVTFINFTNRCPFVFIKDKNSLNVFYPTEIFNINNPEPISLQVLLALGGRTNNSMYSL